jgi:hypothetical protein
LSTKAQPELIELRHCGPVSFELRDDAGAMKFNDALVDAQLVGDLFVQLAACD